MNQGPEPARAHVDQSRCRGHGQCAAVAPQVFVVGEDDRAHLLVPEGEVPAGLHQAVDDAIAMCPEAAISWAPPR